MSTEDTTMFRLIGFLIGSISSIVIILLIVGMPRFHLADQKADQQRYDEAIDKLKAKQHEFESVAGKLSADVARVAESVEHGFDSLAETVAVNTPLARQTDTGVEAPGEPIPVAIDDDFGITDANITDANIGAPAETLWYSFWNPFRSEIAANGFVSQLEKVTGIDYRVVKIKSGVYEVAFAYNDDEERRTKLSQISSATGLDLPDS